MQPADEYILGTDALELERLGDQHGAWAAQAAELWTRAGIGAGDAVLDLGCGPGFTTFALAELVGASGRVVARDESERFLAHVAAEAERLGHGQVEPSVGRVEDLELQGASLDAAYARWLFCWLDDPRALLARLARSLRPGGALVIQDYLDWGAMSLVPTSAVFDRAVATCLDSWKHGGVTIDVARRLPSLARECGFEVEHFQPVARLGPVGSAEWCWLEGFFESYLPRLVARGLLDERGHEAWRDEWRARAADAASWVQTPTVADLVLRVPGGPG